MIARSIKVLAAVLVLGGLLSGPSAAATFKAGRGISLDIWITWPEEAQWSDPSVMLPFPEWRRHVGATQLETLKQAGFDMVRIPVDPAVFLSPRTAGLRGRIMASVMDAVRIVTNAGLNVIVDLHTIPTGAYRSVGTNEILADDSVFEDYLALVRGMAGQVSVFDPGQVALELFNEPAGDCNARSKAEWADKLFRLWAAARASAPDTTLVLTGACWGSAEGLDAIDPREYSDGNVIWSFHSYAPFILTNQGAGWTGDISPYATGLPYPPHGANADAAAKALDAIRTRVMREAPAARRDGIIAFVEEELARIDTPDKLTSEMSAPFGKVAKWADDFAIAREDILLGEFGMIRQEHGQDFATNPKWRADYYRDMIALAASHGFRWSIWGYGGAFGVVEAFEGRAAEPDALDVVRALK